MFFGNFSGAGASQLVVTADERLRQRRGADCQYGHTAKWRCRAMRCVAGTVPSGVVAAAAYTGEGAADSFDRRCRQLTVRLILSTDVAGN